LAGRIRANADPLLFGKLFYLITVLDLIDEDLGGFETGDIVFINYDGSVARDIAGNFLLSFLVDKASKATDIDILSAGHRGFDDTEECFYGRRNIGFVNSGFFSDLGDYVCLGHGCFI
jgi:hypothetical protein